MLHLRGCWLVSLADGLVKACTTMQASRQALAQDELDTRMGAIPFIPTHDVDMGVFTSVMAGDYDSARMFAGRLQHVRRHFPEGTYSAGSDVLTRAEVDLQWGRCALTCLGTQHRPRCAAF